MPSVVMNAAARPRVITFLVTSAMSAPGVAVRTAAIVRNISMSRAHSGQCHLVCSLLGLDRLWGRAMPCRWPFERGRAIREGARGYCDLKSDSPTNQTGHG